MPCPVLRRRPPQVTLADMYKGKTSKLALSKQVLCGTCGGAGGKKGAAKYVPGLATRVREKEGKEGKEG